MYKPVSVLENEAKKFAGIFSKNGSPNQVQKAELCAAN